MRKALGAVLVVACAGTLGLGAPDPRSAFIAPGGGAWVDLETVPPRPGTDQLLPTQRLRLEARGASSTLVLLDGLKSLCDTDVRWQGDHALVLRVSEQWEPGLRVHDGQRWEGVTLRVLIHQDQVAARKPSPDGRFSLVVIRDCESDAWNLYLRRAGEPDYNAAMGLGWGDPELFGGYPSFQPMLDLEWTGPASACVEVAYRPNGVTRRKDIEGVRMEWVFQRRYSPSALKMNELGTLDKSKYEKAKQWIADWLHRARP